MSSHERRLKNRQTRENRTYRNKRRYQDKKELSKPDNDYGSNSNQPDLEETEPNEFEARKRAVIESLTLWFWKGKTQTRHCQRKRPLVWGKKGSYNSEQHSYHSEHRKTTSGAKAVDQILYDAVKYLDIDALRYGIVHETLAITQYEKEMGCKVTHPTGLIVHKDYPFIAATPDGIVSDDLILGSQMSKSREKNVQ